jgi:hypothetical protein
VLVYVSVKLGLTLGEEHRLKLFENRPMGRMFGPKREKVAGRWGN